ncbi:MULTISPECIES: hypothetical protein [Pigmentiphaga]
MNTRSWTTRRMWRRTLPVKFADQRLQDVDRLGSRVKEMDLNVD